MRQPLRSRVRRRVGAVFLLLGAAGCANLPGPSAERAVGIDGQACIGSLAALPPELAATANPALLAHARLASGQGGTCAAQVVAVNSPLVLYRVFDSSRPNSRLGGWWTLSPPAGPRDAYRTAFAICPEWSGLDRLVACEVRPGSQLVVGTTQSATCADGSTLAKTAAVQVFVPNDGTAGIVHVGACSDATPWP